MTAQTTYLARSAKGHPVAAYDSEAKLRAFAQASAAKRVKLSLFKVTVKEEEL